MRIGDPVSKLSTEAKRERLAFAALVSSVGEELDARDIWDGDRSMGDPVVDLGGRVVRFLRRLRRLGSGKPTGPGIDLKNLPKAGFVGLRPLLELAHDTAQVHYERNLINIAVPYTHVAVLSDQSTLDLGPLEDRLEREIWSHFGQYVDPRLGVRVRFFTADGYSGLRAYFFGSGIFLPEQRGSAGARAGELSLRKAAGSPEFTPALPDAMPAAFYPGQTGLAFSGNNILTPAVSAEVLGEEATLHKSVFYVGRRRETSGVTFEAMIPDRMGAKGKEVRYRLADGAAGGPELREDVTIEPGRWYTVRRMLGYDRTDVFQFRYTGDGLRSGRLQPRRPDGPVLEVIAINLPSPLEHQSVVRQWLDFTEEGHLCSHWLAKRAHSLVVGRAGTVGMYDRAAATFRRRGQHFADQPVFQAGNRSLQVQPVEGSGGQFIEVSDAAGGALGYISLPDPRRATSWGLSTVSTSEESHLSLDWLDAAGLVELASDQFDEGQTESTRDVAQRVIGLGQWSLATASMEWGPGEVLMVRDKTGEWMRLPPGEPHDIGPIRVRYRQG